MPSLSPPPAQVGLDFSVLTEGLLASAGWDDTTWVWHQSQDPRGG